MDDPPGARLVNSQEPRSVRAASRSSRRWPWQAVVSLGRREVGRAVGSFDRAARASFLGVVVAALVAVLLGLFITSQTRHDLIVAEQRGLQTAVAAIADRLPELDDALTDAELEGVHELVKQAILGGSHVRVKLWALDGTVRYSDARELVGRRFEDEVAELEALRGSPGFARTTDLSDPENRTEASYGSLIEFYIPVRDEDGRAAGVFEVYSTPAELEAALDRISTATWAAIALGLGLLTLFLTALVWSTVRRVDRDRTIAQQNAETSAILVHASDALATSLEPRELLERLSIELTDALRLESLQIRPEADSDASASSYRLADGTWLVAVRSGEPFSSDEERLLRSVTGSLDAALANAALYARVDRAASERRQLIRSLETAHEEERRTIVGELHDLLAGDLIRLLYGVRGIIARSPSIPDAIGEELHSLEMRVSETEQRLRSFMGRLRPVEADQGGFVLAMEQAVGRVRQDGDLQVRLRVSGPAEGLTAEVRRVLLRTTEEALLNVVKHAAAQRVLVRLRIADTITLSIDDDGRGWDDAETERSGHGMGLAYARERVGAIGGTLTTGRSRLCGARLVIELPREARGR